MRKRIINSLMVGLSAHMLLACGGSDTGTSDTGTTGAPQTKLLAETGCAGSSCYGYNPSSTSVQFYVNSAPWADLHYSVNGGAQLNVRMAVSGTNNTYTVSNLKAGDVVRYYFTIGKSSGGASTTTATTLTMGSTTPTDPTPTDPTPTNPTPTNPTPTDIVPLYGASTTLEPVTRFDRGDALVTRIADRARDRHAKESQFQSYDHYLSFYWQHRTATIEIVDYVAKGGTSVRMNVQTQWKLNTGEAENRWFYRGVGTVAEFCDNEKMTVVNDFNYWKERSVNCLYNFRQIAKGDKLEFELSQFLDKSVEATGGRAAYYGTTFLYIVGEGLVPWDVGGSTPHGGIKDSVKIPESAWLGGRTTIHASTSGEPDNRFMQMAGNLAPINGQTFVLGRRVHHSSFVNGVHDERPAENPAFTELSGKAGPRYVKDSCAGCHVRNGRAAPQPVGVALDKWIFKVGDANGNPHPALGRVLQPVANSGASSEGSVSIASWTVNGSLRKPNYQFSGTTPNTFSGRIAPSLIGMGLLEAIPESAILAKENPNGTGISGRANRIVDPSGVTRLGRFGYKAGTTSVRHQVAQALNSDMGVNNSVLPNPDCGSSQTGCGASGSELSDTHLANLVKYIQLLGVPPQRDYNNASVANGKAVFTNIGCAGCHTPSFTTSANHPLAELRSQTISPYTDMLLHDMGPGLADNLGEGQASGAEWRTAPLWGLGLNACVTGGMTVAPQGQETCTPVHSYLHDGRARTIDEAILWHGGEGEAAKNAYVALSSTQKTDLLNFLNSL